MLSRPLVVKVLAPLVILGVVVGLVKVFGVIEELPTNTASRRSDSIYISKITTAYPVMRDSFTISGVEIKNSHWAIVTIKNSQNGDTLRALLYDPKYSSDEMQLVYKPSKRVSFDDIMSPANSKISGESDDATE